jgi:transmembrane sensor
MKESDQIDALLVKVMLKEATENEHQQVTKWLESDQENRRYYVQFQKIWQESLKISVQSTVDENAAWNRFKNRTAQQQTIIEHPAGRSSSWLRVAAVFVAVIGAAVLLLLNRHPAPELLTVSSNDTPLSDTLPDGSVIHLNRHSKLEFASDFTGSKQRAVKLKGEAFFEVAKDPEKPFVIEVSNAVITVLGTSFNVRSTAEITEVIVETGLVEVKNQHQKMKVAPDEMAVITVDKASLTKQKKTDDLYNYYFTNTLICHNTPLPQLVSKLSEAYNRPIVIENNALQNKEINTVIDMRKTFEENIFIINQTLGITAYTKNDTLFLK